MLSGYLATPARILEVDSREETRRDAGMTLRDAPPMRRPFRSGVKVRTLTCSGLRVALPRLNPRARIRPSMATRGAPLAPRRREINLAGVERAMKAARVE